MNNICKAFIPSLLLSILFIISLQAQDSLVYRQVNTQVWEKFEESFKTNNVELFSSLHTNNIIRIPADSKTILTGKEYFESQINSFKWVKENGYKTEMELRFIERINFDTCASERGIFKFTVTEPEGTQRFYYGKFHVILQKEAGIWKIAMDYDSSENETINENSFKNSYDKWDFNSLIINN